MVLIELTATLAWTSDTLSWVLLPKGQLKSVWVKPGLLKELGSAPGIS